MSLNDVIEQSTGVRPGDHSPYSATGSEPASGYNAGGSVETQGQAAAGRASLAQSQRQPLGSGPSLSFHTQQGVMRVDALTLAVYGILLADLLLLLIALKV